MGIYPLAGNLQVPLMNQGDTQWGHLRSTLLSNDDYTEYSVKAAGCILLPFLEKYQDRMMMMPASSKNWHHSAFAGGYTDHVLRVYDCAIKLYNIWGEMEGDLSTYTLEQFHLFLFQFL